MADTTIKNHGTLGSSADGTATNMDLATDITHDRPIQLEGLSCDFDGANDYIDCSNGLALNGSDISVEGWIHVSNWGSGTTIPFFGVWGSSNSEK